MQYKPTGLLIILISFLFILSLPNTCPAQRRNHTQHQVDRRGRRVFSSQESIDVGDEEDMDEDKAYTVAYAANPDEDEASYMDGEKDDHEDYIIDGDPDYAQVVPDKVRLYNIMMDFGIGNLSYEEHSNLGSSGEQGNYSSDLMSIKGIFSVTELKGRWSIDVGGGILGTTNRVEKWWSNQRLFRVNKLNVRGLNADAFMKYHMKEKELTPFGITTQPNIGIGFVYYFYGLKREQGTSLIETTIKIPMQVDFALFGIEPVIGLDFSLDEGRIKGYVNVGTGTYGASVEKNYEGRNTTAVPNKTYARSVLAKIGLRGELGRLYYHLGYAVARFKITPKNGISDCRINLGRLVGYLGLSF